MLFLLLQGGHVHTVGLAQPIRLPTFDTVLAPPECSSPRPALEDHQRCESNTAGTGTWCRLSVSRAHRQPRCRPDPAPSSVLLIWIASAPAARSLGAADFPGATPGPDRSIVIMTPPCLRRRPGWTTRLTQSSAAADLCCRMPARVGRALEGRSLAFNVARVAATESNNTNRSADGCTHESPSRPDGTCEAENSNNQVLAVPEAVTQ